MKQVLYLLAFLVSVQFAFGQTISGTITDGSGLPLISASVVEKGAANGVLTNADGNYSITLTTNNPVILVSYVGFATQEIVVGDHTTIEVVLQEAGMTLDEVIVVGYGTQRRGDVTAAISNVNVEDARNIATTSVDQIIQGRVPGVNVTQTAGGAPGGGLQVNIRGIGTINSESPLYVIDGIPVQESGANQLSSTFLNSLNPNDIESIDILKDAS
ncbi:MAG: TonB-dependent receptor plug domain-containing protein, partial [Bacteroidota bacterium]